ncbi:hypothetical protein LAV_00051 [Sphingobium phage Lacusarx]|uniref:Uncharacterized protein n=1 Tax=Sphingobium phage Lacusarx TaxID=1980139 RepID=A0A1W6DX32_9CAUD|nr:hypothetical protein FDH44_gp051 [Sphingobium phage Lacusarx]ARK07451.1 hypothetical protein LAV_00051 [Sphingobium phage Lacusarx]
MAALGFKDKLFESFTASQGEKKWKFDRNASVGASEAFTCMRKVFFKKFGYEPDDDHVADWGAARRGDVIENEVAVPAVAGLLPDTAQLLFAGEEQETIKKGRLSATPDGLVVDAPDDALEDLGVPSLLGTGQFVVEFKSFDPRASIKEAKPVHIGQTQVQMGLLHDLTNYTPKFAVIVYINASIMSDIRCFVVPYDPKAYEAAEKRAQQVFSAQEPTDLPPEGKLSGDCNLCEFHEECAIAQGISAPKEKRTLPADVTERLGILAARQKDADARKKDAETEKKEAEEEIKQLLRDHGSKNCGDDSFSVNLSWCSGKKSLDQLAMAADGIDLEKYQKEGSGYDRLVVKLK